MLSSTAPVISALVLTFGLHLAFGTYEVVWSLYLVALGATVAWVGVSFMLFSIPEIIVAPFAGRYVDRKGPLRPIIITGLVIVTTGTVYALSRSYLVSSFVAPVEAAATAAMMPALYTILGRGTPTGRSSTTQGLFGATSTLGLVVASVVAGTLFEVHIGLPFIFFVVGIAVSMVVGLLIYPQHPLERGCGDRGACADVVAVPEIGEAPRQAPRCSRGEPTRRAGRRSCPIPALGVSTPDTAAQRMDRTCKNDL